MPQPAYDVFARASRVKLLILDVDGVLTDGRIIYTTTDAEVKLFDVEDGHWLKLLERAGLPAVWLSGRASAVNQRRAKELGAVELHEGAKAKLPIFEEILQRQGVTADQVAYLGDDIVDLPPMRAAGLALAPADAVPQVKQVAHWVLPHPGGRGAVRLACEVLLKATGKWQEVSARYY